MKHLQTYNHESFTSALHSVQNNASPVLVCSSSLSSFLRQSSLTKIAQKKQPISEHFKEFSLAFSPSFFKFIFLGSSKELPSPVPKTISSKLLLKWPIQQTSYRQLVLTWWHVTNQNSWISWINGSASNIEYKHTQSLKIWHMSMQGDHQNKLFWE